MATATQTARPRRRLQFSLRLLLFAMLAFAVGFPIWYRLPYEEVEVLQPTLPGRAEVTRKTTWQRQWGGGRLRHGTETRVAAHYTWMTTYNQGVEDGPYQELLDGQVVVSGQYRDGQRDGTWRHVGQNESKRTVNWRDGKLHGLYDVTEIFGFNRQFQLQFHRGKLIRRDGQKFENHLFELYQSGKIDDPRLAEELTRIHGCAFDTSLRDALALLARGHKVTIETDETKGGNFTARAFEAFWDIDLCSALTLLTEPNGLACDYRYGCLWVTTAADVRDWRDPTGVAKIEPPEGSVLAGAWNEPVSIAANNQPLAAALMQLCQPLAVSIDTSQLTSGDGSANPPVTRTMNRHPFRHVLGALLYKAGCRCELDGDTLVILPPDAPTDKQE